MKSTHLPYSALVKMLNRLQTDGVISARTDSLWHSTLKESKYSYKIYELEPKGEEVLRRLGESMKKNTEAIEILTAPDLGQNEPEKVAYRQQVSRSLFLSSAMVNVLWTSLPILSTRSPLMLSLALYGFIFAIAVSIALTLLISGNFSKYIYK